MFLHTELRQDSADEAQITRDDGTGLPAPQIVPASVISAWSWPRKHATFNTQTGRTCETIEAKSSEQEEPCCLALTSAGNHCLQTSFQVIGGPGSKVSPQVASCEPESWGLLPRSLPHRRPALSFAPQTECLVQSPAHIEAGSGLCEGSIST